MYNGNKYRLQKIIEMQKQMEAEKEKREQLEKKYKKGIKAIKVFDYVLATSIMTLSAVGVGLLATIVAAPGVITTGTVTMGVSVLFIISKEINRKLAAKAKKHEKLRVLSEEVLNKITNHISMSLNDNKISDQEFSLILTEFNTYLETKEKLCSTPTENTDILKIVKPFLHIKNSVI